MPWKTAAICILCLSLVFFARGLFQNKDTPETDKLTTQEATEKQQKVEHSQLPQSHSVTESQKSLSQTPQDKNQASTPRLPQPGNERQVQKHVHTGTAQHEGCTECEALAAKQSHPLSFAVDNLRAENSHEYVSSLLSNLKGVSVGHACAESGRLDLIYAPGLTNTNDIRQALDKAGINVNGNIFSIRVEGTITPQKEQQLKNTLDNMEGVTLRKVSGSNGHLEFLVTNPTTQENQIAQTLRKSGYKVKKRRP